jgi:hypothetical protein
MSDIHARLDALESREQIRQLVARHALALDSRDLGTLVDLYVEDVQTSDGRIGRDALATWFDVSLRRYEVTFHLIGNHLIDLLDADHATGLLYCRPEYQVGDLWIVMPLQYRDRYERHRGRWYFRSRSVHAFYAADIRENPAAVPGRFHFPGAPVVPAAELPELWPSWRAFWASELS